MQRGVATGLPGCARENAPPEKDGFDGAAAEYDYDEMPDVRIAEWAIGALQDDRDRPFFLGSGYRPGAKAVYHRRSRDPGAAPWSARHHLLDIRRDSSRRAGPKRMNGAIV